MTKSFLGVIAAVLRGVSEAKFFRMERSRAERICEGLSVVSWIESGEIGKDV